MRQISNGMTLLGAIVALVLVAQGTAAAPSSTASSDYIVGSSSTPGADTGLLLSGGQSVTATATGAFCPFGDSYCVGPDGYPPINTLQSSFGSFVLPGAPAWGLVGRVGDGPWVQVGSGPTTLSGTGELVFSINDDLWSDNAGSFTVTVSYSCPRRSDFGACGQTVSSASCYPGNGYGDLNHDHSGPPGQEHDACRPGWGYGDDNHNHRGPPGQSDTAANESSTSQEGRGRK